MHTQHILNSTVYRQLLLFLVTLFLIKSVPTKNLEGKVEKFSLISNFPCCNAYNNTTVSLWFENIEVEQFSSFINGWFK
jgi:hypothetical protein